MHSTALVPLLAIASTSLAVPLKRNSPSYEVENFYTKIYSNNTLGTFQFTVQNPSAELSDDCYRTW